MESNTLLYGELARFYPLLDPLDDHADEAQAYGDVLCSDGAGGTLLELGAGAGHGAHFLKRRFSSTTLTDIAEPMLAHSRRNNPDCEHVLGDMRTLRLGRVFDCVLCHDAIAYITTAQDLLAVFDTAWEHLRPGGRALFVPDCLKDTFAEGHEHHVGDDGTRSLRAVSWWHDPDPLDSTHVYDFAFLLREHGGEVRAVHDRHTCGLFSRAAWCGVARKTGFEVDVVSRELPSEFVGLGYCEVMFVLRRPEGA